MKIIWISFVASLSFLFMVSSANAQQYALSQLDRNDLQNFIAEQSSRTLTFKFWTAHPPDAEDPRMAIIWMARTGEVPSETTGVLVYVMATEPSGLSCLKMLHRGDVGRITITADIHARMCEAVLSIVGFSD